MALETSVGTYGPFWQPPNAYLTLDLKQVTLLPIGILKMRRAPHFCVTHPCDRWGKDDPLTSGRYAPLVKNERTQTQRQT